MVAYRECFIQPATISDDIMRHRSGKGYNSTILTNSCAQKQVPQQRRRKESPKQRQEVVVPLPKVSSDTTCNGSLY